MRMLTVDPQQIEAAMAALEPEAILDHLDLIARTALSRAISWRRIADALDRANPSSPS